MNFIRQKLIYICFRWFSQLNSPQPPWLNTNVAIELFLLSFLMDSLLPIVLPNGVRYPRVGETRQRHFNGTG